MVFSDEGPPLRHRRVYRHGVSIAFRLNGLFGLRDFPEPYASQARAGLNSLSAQWSFRTGGTVVKFPARNVTMSQ